MKTMKKINVLHGLILSIFFLVSGCTSNGVQNEPIGNELVIDPGTPYLTEDGYLKPCDLISVSEWQTFFAEAPLFIEEMDGGCRISNQWETRSIFIGLYSPAQAFQTMRWFTQSLEAESNDPELLFQLREVLTNQTDQDIRGLIEERIKLYEALLYRSERIFVIGDYAIWFSYHESSTNIIEILEGDSYLRITLAGFYPVEARKLALDIGKTLIERAPSDFENLFNFNTNLSLTEEQSPTLEAGSPELAFISADPEDIFYGSLCGEESAQIEIALKNDELVNNVVMVYRLTSQAEINPNWTTVFMIPNENGGWIKSLNAEIDFSSYTLADEAVVEVSIGVLYGVDRVYNSPVYRILQVNQCETETSDTVTETPNP
jgi:hypothetical protein